MGLGAAHQTHSFTAQPSVRVMRPSCPSRRWCFRGDTQMGLDANVFTYCAAISACEMPRGLAYRSSLFCSSLCSACFSGSRGPLRPASLCPAWPGRCAWVCKGPQVGFHLPCLLRLMAKLHFAALRGSQFPLCGALLVLPFVVLFQLIVRLSLLFVVFVLLKWFGQAAMTKRVSFW